MLDIKIKVEMKEEINFIEIYIKFYDAFSYVGQSLSLALRYKLIF